MQNTNSVNPVAQLLLNVVDRGSRQNIIREAAEQICCHGMPWRPRIWNNDLNAGVPTNSITQGTYTGITALMMDVRAAKHSFLSKYWGTAEDWLKAGLVVQGDGHDIPYEDEQFNVLRTRLWNADEVRGVTANMYQCQMKVAVQEKANTWDPMRKLLDATKARVFHAERNIAIYEPPTPWRDFPNHSTGDYIELPHPDSCTESRYWSNVGHELIHWAEVRIGWCPRPVKDDPIREFVAEMGSAYILRQLNCPMDDDVENYRHYNRQWLSALSNGTPRWLFDAALFATDAANHVLSYLR